MTLYVLGPGFGESQVFSLPDGRWMVVDCCRHRKQVLPALVLRHFDVSRIDLLVITHPDLDHVEGAEELFRDFTIDRTWRYPGAASIRDLLSGDLLNGAASTHSGWSGVIELLRKDAQESLLADLRVVKVAHHGSKNAFCPEAWKLHARSSKVDVAVLTPFRKPPPPHPETLDHLRPYVDKLVITAGGSSSGDAFGVARQSGWVAHPDAAIHGSGVAIQVDATGSCMTTVGTSARQFGHAAHGDP